MKKMLPAIALLAIVVSCTSPKAYMVRTPVAPDDAFSQCMRKVNELGYTVVDTDRAAGFIRAERYVSGFLVDERIDELTISIFEAGETGGAGIRVTARSLDEDDEGHRSPHSISKDVQNHAQEILRIFATPVEQGA